MNDNKDIINYTWAEYFNDIRQVSYDLRNEEFDCVIGISRGGLIPARMLCTELGVKNLGLIKASFYTDSGRKLETPTVQYVDAFSQYSNVLVVDDIYDTGETMKMIKFDLTNTFNVAKIKTFTLFYNVCTLEKPNYTLNPKYDWEWVTFPWETKLKD